MIPLSITTGVLAEKLGCRLDGNPDLLLNGFAAVETATEDQITFLANMRYKARVANSKAGAILINDDLPTPPGMVRLICRDPYQDFRRALEMMYPKRINDVPLGIHPLAVISESAIIGEGVRIGPFVHICDGAVIGDRTTLFSGSYIGHQTVVGEDCSIGVNAVLRHEVTLGNRVVIGDGCSIGFDGFGYVADNQGRQKIPQVGTVVIGDDVELGANTCVDRAAVGETKLGKGVKIDNLVQIGHGVQVGDHTVIIALSGVAGSVVIGKWVTISGQAGIMPHVKLGDRMVVASQSGVAKSYDTRSAISGMPARPHQEMLRIDAVAHQLPELLKRLRALEKEVAELKKQ